MSATHAVEDYVRTGAVQTLNLLYKILLLIIDSGSGKSTPDSIPCRRWATLSKKLTCMGRMPL